ncbi:LysR substrate-binding domain-containing protein [Nitrospirillum sp. BR 11163]|uniref:LysR substrate-binding domain-containing protein n=1 Tax=Nitrospirillum sp. BR 11163 TaxID=3104323 RepID=UPI002AFE6BA0|nr:LysR substrate-binding domain-containing protein [Nitrospirillum sp. BR 11163]MEA1672220.1 LysR substrate-binding domain-containing protein [Nitrospirillum sp. BR 11163]
MQFDLIDLALFRDVVEAGSITWGAERAHLALAAASTRIRNMEVSLGATLLDRGRHGVTPTPAGRALLAHARAILDQTERLREDLSVYAGGAAGNVRILSNTNALTEFLPELLSSFLNAHPLVSVDVEERLSDEIVAAIADGTGDIGIVAGTVETGDLETYPFRQDRFVLVAAPTHPLGGRETVTFAEVMDHDLVGLDRAAALQRFLSDRASRAGRRLRLRVQLRSFDGICRLVEGNVGIGIVPETTARRAAQTMDIRCVTLTDSWAVRDLKVCTRGRARLPRFAKLLTDHLLNTPPRGPLHTAAMEPPAAAP